MIYFTSDLHLGHKNVIEYNHNRINKIEEYCDSKGLILTNNNIIEMMDRWLIDMWNSQVTKQDFVYILGDFSFHSAEENKKILGKLKGNKILILGNHDSSSKNLKNYFSQITQIKEVKYKKDDKTYCFELCHYPLLSWNRKNYDTIQLHGHCHGMMDYYNNSQPDLRVDVGIDGELANYKLVTPDQILEYLDNKRCVEYQAT